ncbi:MAG: SDR family NAD(P)-dependent oxidoreductase, partial [Deltaproteobacteria bacterium]
MAPRILVTGATGFIGSHLARRLLQEHPLGPDAELVLVVRDPTRLSPALREGARLLVGDLRQADRFREEIAETTWCFHIAAEADYRGGSATVENNVESTRMLLDLLAEAPGLERFVFTSSIGAIDRHPNDPCRRPLTEDDPAHPLTPYGRSKWACEERIRRSPLPWSILRPTWVYGPGMRKTSHIRTFIRMVARRHPVTKFAFPGRVSLIHVTDLVDALLLLAKREEAVGEVYFAADGHPRSLGEIFREIGRYLGIRAGTIPFPRPFIRMMRALRPHLPFAAQNLFSDLLSASNEKLVRLSFTPQVPFAEGLLGTIHWDAREAMPPQERKWSLVTGAGSGIGKAVAQRLYAAGDRLLLVDCNGEALDREARRLEARAFPLDLARPDALETLLQTIEREGIELHRLVNAAGIGIRGTVAELGFEEQQRVIAVNVTALLFLSRFALR